jgi:hypothetical protein
MAMTTPVLREARAAPDVGVREERVDPGRKVEPVVAEALVG